MPKSPSGALRMGIGPAKGRLTKSLQQGVSLADSTVPKNMNDKHKLLNDIWQLLPRMESQIETLTEDKQQWMQLINDIEDDNDKTAEEKLFNDTAYDLDGFMTAVWDAKETVLLLKSLAGRLESSPSQAVETTASAITVNTSTVPVTNERNKVSAKLPKLQLPMFSGDYLEWDQFWQMFRVNIHEAPLSKVEKFAYLLSQITDNARRTIEGISWPVATLQARYERPARQLISSYYSQLKGLSQSSNKVSELQKTYDACERIFRLLEKAGENVSANQSLVLDVYSKYPNLVVERLFSHRGISATSTLAEVRKALSDHIKEAESLSEIFEELKPFASANKNDKGPGIAATKVHDGSSIQHTSALTSAVVEKPKSQASDRRFGNTPKSNCYFCEGSHFNSECTKYATVETRVHRLKSLGRCTRCLSTTHTVEGCRTPSKTITCFFCRQSGDHRSPLCSQRFSHKGPQPAALVTADANDSQPSTISTPQPSPVSTKQNKAEPTLLNAGESSLLLTALSSVTNPNTGQTTLARLLFDSGSHRTYITESCTKQLSLVGCETDTITVATFGSKRTLTVQSSQVEVSILLRDGTSKLLHANTTPIIAGGSILPDRMPQGADNWLEAMHEELADDYTVKPGEIDILVGTDYFWEFITGSRIKTTFGIHLVPSTLGLLLTGKYTAETKPSAAALLCISETRSPIPGLEPSETNFPATYPDIDNFWELECIGIKDDPIENDDERAQEHFNKTVYMKDGRYHVAWPWRPEVSHLPTNYQMALGRFRSLAKRLASNPDVKEKYHKVIDEQLRLGIIEKIDGCANEPLSHPVHYLPHHPVVRPGSATTKVRVVYDASSKTRKDQKSLNECLFRGPVVLPDLCGQLIRFRLNSIAIIADIEKAFLQMALQPNDRDVTRFIWLADPSLDTVDGNMAIYRFCRVPFGVISSPSLLGSTVQYHLKTWNTPNAELIRKNIYVDNAMGTLDNEDLVKPFYDEAKTIFQAAGMNLTEWSSNYHGIEKIIPSSDRSRSQQTKVLGIQWDCTTDMLSLNEPRHLNEVVATKRGVLKFIASIFDPLGWFQPATLPAKCFLQSLWQHNLGWDEPLPSEMREKWSAIYLELKQIFNVEFPRQLGKVTPDSKIIVFCDASADAYAATAYLRTPTEDGYVSTLLFAKSRLSPKGSKDVSIPRLELLGLTIAARATRFVRLSLEQDLPAIIFCDSMCVLGWLKSTKVLAVFIRNRIDEVRKLQNVEFRYVKSSDNPADLGSRGVEVSVLKNSNRWWYGPDWLKLPESSWPADITVEEQADEETSSKREKTTNNPVFHTFVAGEAPPTTGGNDEPNNTFLRINPVEYSSFRRLLRVSVICLKFIKTRVWDRLSVHFQQDLTKLIRIFGHISSTNSITSDEIKVARSCWIMLAQSDAFDQLKKCMESSKPHFLMKQLDTTLHESGIIRCMGRFEHADLHMDTIRPMLLPRQHVITRLIIRETHQKLFHPGVAHTLCQIRREFWVPKGRATVRREITKCLLCRKFKGPRFALPRMPPWPRERVSRSKPFQFVGLDYLGPVSVSLGGEPVKMWICLITCLAVRAVHLEWISDCSAQSFVDCISRFVSRRGSPDQIISDNAPQFRVSKNIFDRAWHKAFADETTISYMSDKGINWKYTTELSPWQGGFYERLVGLVKQTFRVMVGRKMLRWDEFITLITEVEAMVNSRPLTYVYEDFASGFVLRPCDFLTDQPTSIHDIDADRRPEGGDAGKNLIRYWKAKQRRLNKLWEYWYDEYLLSLRERGHINHRGKHNSTRTEPFVDQIVLVKNPGSPRGSWKLGRINKVIPSSDGEIRSVEVMLPSQILIRRSISHLYPIEIETFPDPEVDEQTTNIDRMESAVHETSTEVQTQADHNDDIEDGFSGFSESEVYGDTRIDHVLLTNPAQIHTTINSGLADNAVALTFEMPTRRH